MSLGNLEEKPANCETHGDYTSYRMFGRWTTCPVCAEIKLEQDRERDTIEANEYLRQRADTKRVEKIGLPRMFAESTLGNYVVQVDAQYKVLNACNRYVENFDRYQGRGMIFIGELGNGKTHLGCGVLRELALAGHTATYTTEKAIGLRMKASYRSREESELDIINAYTTPDVLFVDEVGLSTGSDHDAGLLNTVLTERYAESRATIIATNLTAEGLKDWIGERATDRLRQTSSVYLFNWDSYRGKA